MSTGVEVVWFKRDLRLSDHAAMSGAAATGRPVLCLYVYEPELLASPELDSSHVVFINEGLTELESGIRKRGGLLCLRVGSMPEVLAELQAELQSVGGIHGLWSHEETGLAITGARDRRVEGWCREHQVAWTELPQNGVVRGLRDRDGWSRLWQKRMQEEPAIVPNALRSVDPSLVNLGGIRRLAELGLPASSKSYAQRGGEGLARETLESFLDRRGIDYREGMSSPVTAWEACSRLSPYLAWGNVSIRDVYQATQKRRAALRAVPKAEREPGGLGSLASFEGRLRWHCHFIQKFESEPAIEFENMSRAYDGLREDEFDDERFEAWCRGQTGYPLVDACMRCLHRTGWINFRMRAMLVSFASYHLWLHWRRPAVFLARHFLDFEPGIHFSQFQMQSGVTGINAVRIYSPIKQVHDQDPRGDFIRKWVPELAGVPDEAIAEPHRLSPAQQRSAACVIGRDYPAPIVEHTEAYRSARSRMQSARRSAEAREEAAHILEKHGSRRSRARQRSRGSSTKGR